jgi:hypothetical protein
MKQGSLGTEAAFTKLRLERFSAVVYENTKTLATSRTVVSGAKVTRGLAEADQAEALIDGV